MFKICLVEDEKSLNSLIKSYLEKEDYEVISFTKGQDALDYIENNDEANLWILDIMLEDDVTGYDIIKQIRSKNEEIPIIFSSARDQSIDKIMGLELGGDDYIAKPYSSKELVLRVKNILKRVYNNEYKKIKYNNYEIDVEKRTIQENDNDIKLTTLEFDLLLFFIENKGKSLDRETILSKVWGEDYFGSDRVVDDSIRRLRKKMKNLDLSTVYGYGYRLL